MKHVVALSGGKDSTALALRLAEVEPRDYIYVCTPTGNEPPEMFAHWNKLGERKLKIEPYAAWLSKNAPCVSYVGLRHDEREREGGDFLSVPGVEMRFPMREWGWDEKQVWAYLKEKGITIPVRTDCLVCFWQRLIEWYEFWYNAFVVGSAEHAAAWTEGERQEEVTGHTFRSASRDTWPASMKGLRLEFEGGRVPKDTRKDQFGELKCRVCRL